MAVSNAIQFCVSDNIFAELFGISSFAGNRHYYIVGQFVYFVSIVFD
ncbi:hypothetical protein AYI70_g4442, partial [Smittium culicis]